MAIRLLEHLPTPVPLWPLLAALVAVLVTVLLLVIVVVHLIGPALTTAGVISGLLGKRVHRANRRHR